MAHTKLTDTALSAALSGTDLSQWTLVNGKLHREYKFADFASAFAFMTAAALHAEKKDHHPEWFNVYNKVIVDLTTHDAGGVSELDLELARHMENLA